MHCRTWLIGIIVFASASTASAAPQQIHLSWDGPTSTTMTVTWRSSDSSGTVEYGLSSSYGHSVQANSVTYSNSYLHTARITNLSPSSTYHYHCGGAGGWSSDYQFSTGPVLSANSSFRFAAWGDTRTQDNVRAQVTAAVLARNPAFSILTGDLIEGGSNQSLWDQWFTTLQPLGAVSPLLIVIGNHEGSSPLVFQQFALPTHPTASGYNNEAYYSFDYGNTHFVALCTEPTGTVGNPQYKWLDADLANASSNPNIRWIVAFAHRPPYSSGNHGSDATVQKVFVPLFEKYNVDISFWGHDHDYERTKPLIGGKAVGKGPVYVVSGGGGAPLYSVGTSPFTAYSRSINHFTEINVTESQMTIEARDIHGPVIDSLTLTKSALPPPPVVTDAGHVTPTPDSGVDSGHPVTVDSGQPENADAATGPAQTDAGAPDTGRLADEGSDASGSPDTTTPPTHSPMVGCSAGVGAVAPVLLGLLGILAIRMRRRG